MNKFRLISDLHFETNAMNNIRKIISKLSMYNTEKPTEYLILAGDITNLKHTNKLEYFLNSLDCYKKVFYILGNHEYHGISDKKDKKHIPDMYRNVVSKFPNVVLLEDESYKISDDVNIFGTTLWYDILIDKENCASDKNASDKNTSEKELIMEKHTYSKEKIRNLSQDSQNIIITHHIPSLSLIHKKYKNYSPNGYASHCEDVFNSSIKKWCYGHTHTVDNNIYNGIEFICNPQGYNVNTLKMKDCVFVV